MKAIDLTAQRTDLHVRVDSSPAYDFLAAAYMVQQWTPDAGFEVEEAWITAAREALGSKLIRDAAVVLPRRCPVPGILSVLEDAPGASVRGFLRRLEQIVPATLVERMLAGSLAVRPLLPLLRQALRGDRDAAGGFLAAYPREYDVEAIGRILRLRPSMVKSRLLRVLREFYARVYSHEEPRVASSLERDAEERRRLLGMLSPVEVVERATGGFVLTPGAGLSSVLLAPTVFFRPYNLITEYHGVRVFIYPLELREERERHKRPPQELVRLYKALSDETRLRILRLLVDRQMYVQEIAKALGVSHVTAIHHLALLRAAHLVQVIERDNLRYYRLRPEAGREAGRRWQAYLRPAGGE